MNSNKKFFAAAFLCALFVSPFSLRAEETLNPDETSEPQITVTLKDQFTFESDASSMAGQMSVNQSDFELEYEYKAFDVLPLTFGFSYFHTDINDENLPVDLPSHLEGRQFLFGAKFPMPFVESDVYFMGLDLMPSLYTDDWTWEDSAFRLPFRLYGIYKPNDTFLFVLGATINVDADDPVTPIIGFNYQPNDRWDFHLATSEPTISYKLNENWALYAEFGALLDEYEVTRGSQKGVVLKMQEATFGGGIRYKIEDWLEASLSSGASVGRRFQYRDDVGKVDVDGAPYIRARLSFTF